MGLSPLFSSARWESKPEVGELLWRASAVGEEDEAGAAVPEDEIFRAGRHRKSSAREIGGASGGEELGEEAGIGVGDERLEVAVDEGARGGSHSGRDREPLADSEERRGT